MVVLSPRVLDDYIRALPPGRVVPWRELRDELAERFSCDATCPVSTAIFLRVVAEAAWEQHRAGRPIAMITPFWRAIEPDSALARKLTCGREFLVNQQNCEAQAPVQVPRARRSNR